VNYQRALEGELERTLATLSEVEGVRVHLVLPEESLFTEQEHEGQGRGDSQTRSGRLSEQAQLAIPQLVASAVDRLRPENVTVGRRRQQHSAAARAGGWAHLRSGRRAWPRRSCIPWNRWWEADHVRASVHVEYDLGTSEETQETYDPKTATALTQEHSEESSTGEAPAGVRARASNVSRRHLSAPSGTTRQLGFR